MSRKIATKVVPYFSSYELDRIGMSNVIALLLKEKKIRGDVQVDGLVSKDREEWYRIAKTVGLFPPLPDTEVFRLYLNIYEEIKSKYGEKRRDVRHRHLPYWLRYFYFQKKDALFLKPKDECIEILRSMVCPVFDDIKKKFEKKEKENEHLRVAYASLLGSLKSYISSLFMDERISNKEFLFFMRLSGYSSTFIKNTNKKARVLEELRKDGLDLKIIPVSERIKNLVFHKVKEKGKQFLVSSELDKIIKDCCSMFGKKGSFVRLSIRKAVAEKYLIVQREPLARVLEEACSVWRNSEIEKKRVEEIVRKHYSQFHHRFVDRVCKALLGFGIRVK